MVAEHTKYLAEAIITEHQIVTYRLLSRVLKVHNNIAKRMLFEFHQQQSSKKKGSIHATYFITGTQVSIVKPRSTQHDDDEIPMPSSPYPSSAIEQPDQREVEPIRQKVLTLVKEEDLEDTKAKYESISSIHIYSLESSTIQNLEVLSTVTQKIITDYISEDPLIHNKNYGIIQNPQVKRRSGARPPPAPLPVKRETKSAFANSKDPKASGENKIISKPKEAPSGSGEQATRIGVPTLLNRESSDLFKSFAKTKPRTAKPEAETGGDVPMKDVSSDDEGEDVDLPTENKDSTNEQRNKRLAQQEKLRKMMEQSDDDEPMEDAGDLKAEPQAEVEEDNDPDVDTPGQGEVEEEQASAPIDAPSTTTKKQEEEEEQQPVTTVSGGRRRGRRKVMKKKTKRDAEGYLVTKEEAVYESFSEDEVVPASKSKTPAASAGSLKGKKPAAGRPGQGNIMTFFGKK